MMFNPKTGSTSTQEAWVDSFSLASHSTNPNKGSLKRTHTHTKKKKKTPHKQLDRQYFEPTDLLTQAVCQLSSNSGRMASVSVAGCRFSIEKPSEACAAIPLALLRWAQSVGSTQRFACGYKGKAPNTTKSAHQCIIAPLLFSGFGAKQTRNN